MTRLTSAEIQNIPAGLKDYDRELRGKTGRNLLGVACHAAGIQLKNIARRLAKTRVAVIPFTAGEGLIPHFAETVAAIGKHIGLNTFITAARDAAGIAQAVEKRAHWLWLADDDRFVLVDLMRRRVVDNSAATGRGFAAGLDLMAGGVAGRDAAVIGCGAVGRSAAQALMGLKARVTLHDIDRRQAQAAAEALGQADVRIEDDFTGVVAAHDLLVEATSMGAVIPDMAITANTYIAAPGMPLGLTAAAQERIGTRLLHDPLSLGVATMAAMALVTAK